MMLVFANSPSQLLNPAAKKALHADFLCSGVKGIRHRFAGKQWTEDEETLSNLYICTLIQTSIRRSDGGAPEAAQAAKGKRSG